MVLPVGYYPNGDIIIGFVGPSEENLIRALRALGCSKSSYVLCICELLQLLIRFLLGSDTLRIFQASQILSFGANTFVMSHGQIPKY